MFIRFPYHYNGFASKNNSLTEADPRIKPTWRDRSGKAAEFKIRQIMEGVSDIMQLELWKNELVIRQEIRYVIK